MSIGDLVRPLHFAAAGVALVGAVVPHIQEAVAPKSAEERTRAFEERKRSLQINLVTGAIMASLAVACFAAVPKTPSHPSLMRLSAECISLLGVSFVGAVITKEIQQACFPFVR